jgi:predicted negative regulator of RcsB-dependent stress response
MDEDLSIINTNARNEKIKNFFVNNKNKIIFGIIILVIIVTAVYSLEKYLTNKKKEISDNYNSIIIEYSENSKDETANKLIEIIGKKDPTYSPLSLYFIIDNDLVSDKKVVFNLFKTIINDTSLDKEIKNLVIYKKALFYAAEIDDNENDLLDILNPLINSESVWKSHALYLMGEYYFSKNQKQKAKEFYEKIIASENTNPDINKEVQKRLNRDFSE